jgi:hypothetical protein
MRIQSNADPADFVEIERAEVGSDWFDVPLVVRASRKGFTAQVDVWVPRAAVASFAEDLAALVRSHQGKACLGSMAQGEFSLTVRSLDRAGHMGIEGALCTNASGAEVSMTFSAFPFDPSVLPAVVRETTSLAEAPPMESRPSQPG